MTVSTGGRRAVDTTSLEGSRFQVNNESSNNINNNNNNNNNENDEKDGDETARSALKFFFSPNGKFFRDFLLEEIANVADSYSREVLFTLGKRFGVDPTEQIKSLPGGGLLLPGIGLINALNPPLTKKDKQNLKEISTLLSFLAGRDGMRGGGGAGLDLTDAGQKLLPVVNEYREETRQFVTTILLRLTEKRISRGLNYLVK